MALQTHDMEHEEFLFSNVRVQSVRADEAAHSLTLQAVYAEREHCSITYRDVLHSQLGQTLCGKRIAVALDLSPTALAAARYQKLVARLGAECGLAAPDGLTELAQHGYHFFVHFIGSDEEGVVVAKRVTLGPWVS